jgi:hypothetical protein
MNKIPATSFTSTNAFPLDFGLERISAEAPTALAVGYLDAATATRLGEAVQSLSLAPYEVTIEDPIGPAFFYGANLYDVRPDLAQSASRYDYYFERALPDSQRFNDVIAAFDVPHPVYDIFVPLLEATFGTSVTVAHEGERPYYTPVVRSTSNGIHAHTDNSPLEAEELVIGTVTAQRSLLLYLAVPGDGTGAVEVFHKRPTDDDVLFNKGSDYGFSDAAIDGVEVTHIVPEVGDLLAFDSWNIHRVLPSAPDTRRFTVSTFFGFMPDGSIVLWS